MNRAEHLQWCKDRALEYVDQGDLASAIVSMQSDLGKHPETASSADPALMALALPDVITGNAVRVRDFIEGFN